MAISVTLRQEKTDLPALVNPYRVVSDIILADPVGMYPLFVVSIGVGGDTDEQYEGVVTLEDLDKYVEVQATVLEAAVVGQFTGASGTLTITNATTQVPEWFDTYFTAATFVVESVDGTGTFLTVSSAKEFPTAAGSLAWSVSGGALSGTGAKSRRADTSKTTFLRRRWTSLLATVAAAESRFASIQASVESVVNAADVHGVTFTGVVTDVYT